MSKEAPTAPQVAPVAPARPKAPFAFVDGVLIARDAEPIQPQRVAQHDALADIKSR